MALTKEQIKNLKPGDIVREVGWHGVEPSGIGNIYEVEANNETVIMLRNNPCNIALAPCFLELVHKKNADEISLSHTGTSTVTTADKDKSGNQPLDSHELLALRSLMQDPPMKYCK